MRYQVPQFVDIEDKVIGPLTVKQFLIYLFTAMLLVPVYLTSDLALFVTIAIPIVAVAALFAHLKPNGKSLFTAINNAVKFITRGQLWLWRRQAPPTLLPVTGDEYARWSPNEPVVSSALAEQARFINTGGTIVATDAADPYEDNSQ